MTATTVERRLRWLVLVLALMALVYGLLPSSTTPRLTVTNEALLIAWPGRAVGQLALACAGAVVLVGVWGQGWPLLARLTGFALVLGLALASLERACLLYTLDAVGLERRGLLGRTRIAWRDVTRVEAGSVALVAFAGDRQVRVATAVFAPELRATVERNIARHVREARSPGSANPP
jgi:hypothetical protein